MNELRKLNALISNIDSQISATERKIVSHNSDDEIERDEHGAPKVFQGAVDLGVFGKLTKHPRTLFERSLEFQRRHPEAFLQLGTEHGYDTVVAAFREGHEKFLERLESERHKEESDIEIEIGTNDGEFVFDDE